MANEQESFRFEDKQDLASPPKATLAQERKAEGCPYHNGRFEYGCYICNPR